MYNIEDHRPKTERETVEFIRYVGNWESFLRAQLGLNELHSGETIHPAYKVGGILNSAIDELAKIREAYESELSPEMRKQLRIA